VQGLRKQLYVLLGQRRWVVYIFMLSVLWVIRRTKFE